MAATMALPPFSTLHADLSGPKLTADCEGGDSLLSGFESRLVLVKSEQTLEECMGSFCNNTYTELTAATFSRLKDGQADLYGDSTDGQTFSSWTHRHPEHWGAQEVLDWVFSLTEADDVDGALFRGEAYNSLTGKQLCSMTRSDFISLDRCYGARVYDVFQILLRDANFKRPPAPESMAYEGLGGNMPNFACLECPNDVSPARTHTPSTVSPAHRGRGSRNSSNSSNSSACISIFLDKKGHEMKVSLDGLGLYDIDLSLNGCRAFDNIDDSDCSSGSASDADVDRCHSVSSDVFEPMFTDDDDEEEDSSSMGDAPQLLPELSHTPQHPQTPSSSSDSGIESDERRPQQNRRRATTTSKGNHLWEFVRDLLKDSRFNPTLVKWEDKQMGVFKFVQSEAVAQMWGRKKNNPGMTYEKLSRAMRFCRSAGYFDAVPRTGRFPKKLCFKFGHKAHDWLD